jgi:hypothetical protein
VARDSQVALTCGGDSFSAGVLRSAPGAELADHPASEALRAAIRNRDVLSDAGWRLAILSRDEALFLLERQRSDGTTSYWRAGFTRGAPAWRLADHGTCELRPAFGTGYGAAWWELAPGSSPAFDTTTIEVLVTEQACSGGASAEGRVAEPAITYAAAITVYFGVKTLPGGRTCQPGPPILVSVDLAEPVAERPLLDGGVFPPEQRWP